MSPRILFGAALVAAALSGPAMAFDTTWTFTGPCENDRCRDVGPDGTTPASVTATITLSDLSWVARADGSYEASASDAFDFGYNGPGSILPVGSAPVNGDVSYFFSSTPSVDGIFKFDVLWGEATAGAPALGYLSGDSSGWEFGTYFLLPPFGLPARLPWNSSPIPGQWSASAVPEPGGLVLFVFGLAGTLMGVFRRRPDNLFGARDLSP